MSPSRSGRMRPSPQAIDTPMSQETSSPLPEGYQLEEYQIERQLSVGGFSIVYLARDEQGSAVAITACGGVSSRITCTSAMRSTMPRAACSVPFSTIRA